VASARLRAYRPAAALALVGSDSAVHEERRLPRADVVVFQKTYENRHLRWAARLRRRGVTVILDVCDNHFYNPSGDRRLGRRADRLRRMIDLADLVTVSTPTLARFVEHDHVVVIDDAVEPPVATPPTVDGTPAVVWFGNAGSEALGFGMADLGAIVPSLEVAHRQAPFRLTVVSNSREAFERYVGRSALEASYVDWTLHDSSAVLRPGDVAVLPVTSNPFTEGKTANRVITALQSGLAVVAGNIPSYEEFAPVIKVGEWSTNLAAYLDDADARRRDVTAGQRYIATRFPPDHLTSQWHAAIAGAAAQRASTNAGKSA
jgi:hypothetical protein